MTGFTAYMGLLDIGNPQPGETVVVAAATGAVGSVVGQIAKLKGCKVVGIAGGAEKCRYAKETLGFDHCVDHRQDDLAEQLKQHCPDGIDVYFENVGGKVFNAVLPLMNTKGRIPVCGLIADYNSTDLPEGRDHLPLLQSAILRKRLRVQGFIINQDYGDRFDEFFRQMSQWVAEDRLVFREHIVDDLENAPEAFTGMLEGKTSASWSFVSRQINRESSNENFDGVNLPRQTGRNRQKPVSGWKSLSRLITSLKMPASAWCWRRRRADSRRSIRKATSRTLRRMILTVFVTTSPLSRRWRIHNVLKLLMAASSTRYFIRAVTARCGIWPRISTALR